jgi:uncharacterized repeat protein (TIGR02543 family)
VTAVKPGSPAEETAKLEEGYVAFHSNGATTLANPNKKKITEISKNGIKEYIVTSLPTPPKKIDHSFVGWNTEENGNGSPFSINTDIGQNSLMVYAQWVKGLPDSSDYPETNSDVTYTPKIAGYYQIELWGAQGWNPPAKENTYAGRGGYARGILEITDEEVTAAAKFVLSVGGIAQGGTGGNGGGGSNNSGFKEGGGGGATDLRWGGDTLYDRIIVAAGGGGANTTAKTGEKTQPSSRFWTGGFGGGLTGGDSNATADSAPGKGATQTAGGIAGEMNSNPGSFGFGGNYDGESESSGGGGGGYWGGGGGGQRIYNGGGGGGSSFISGYTGCVAIAAAGSTASSSASNTATGEPDEVLTGIAWVTDPDSKDVSEVEYTVTIKKGVVPRALHFSGKAFIPELSIKIGENEAVTYTTTMIAGDKDMPSPDGENEKGHSGSGYIRITYLGNKPEVTADTGDDAPVIEEPAVDDA